MTTDRLHETEGARLDAVGFDLDLESVVPPATPPATPMAGRGASPDERDPPRRDDPPGSAPRFEFISDAPESGGHPPAAAIIDLPTPAAPEASPAIAAATARTAPALPDAGEEPGALAFATDPASERVLREGLSDHPDPQIRPGGLRMAIAALAEGHPSRLVFVDLDETPYAAGALHELAAVCDAGTAVIAFGSDGTARFGREILLAGVSDYLVKPITAAMVREAAARAANAGQPAPNGGRSIGFTGTGGSGATTVAAATALLAASRGRYVSVLDLDRTFPALAFALDVEPAPGLVELLSTVARASLHPEMVDEMRVERSDRIAVYGYPWSAAPPPLPPVWAVCELLVEMQRRSHLVLVDGLDDAATRLALLAMVDARVLVVEPTGSGAAAAAHLLGHLGPMLQPGWPLLFVQNHTRAFSPKTGARALRDAGVEAAPDAVLPFEPTLPAVTDRGWPESRLPKSLRKPLAALADRILDDGETLAVPAAA